MLSVPKGRHGNPRVMIIDYGLGNLFSTKRACEAASLEAEITSDSLKIMRADALILPGVGAFGDAMKAIRNLELIGAIEDFVSSGKPILGVCLGMQLLMSESFEFGHHEGLGIVPGSVVRFENSVNQEGRAIKVPQVGWNQIYPSQEGADNWRNSILRGMREGEYMYFVHSYYVKPADGSVVLSWTRYGQTAFCSGLRWKNVSAFQFHPERSGPAGLRIYRNFARLCGTTNKEQDIVETDY